MDRPARRCGVTSHGTSPHRSRRVRLSWSSAALWSVFTRYRSHADHSRILPPKALSNRAMKSPRLAEVAEVADNRMRLTSKTATVVSPHWRWYGLARCRACRVWVSRRCCHDLRAGSALVGCVVREVRCAGWSAVACRTRGGLRTRGGCCGQRRGVGVRLGALAARWRNAEPGRLSLPSRADCRPARSSAAGLPSFAGCFGVPFIRARPAPRVRGLV